MLMLIFWVVSLHGLEDISALKMEADIPTKCWSTYKSTSP
jgi:hypothetical protein